MRRLHARDLIAKLHSACFAGALRVYSWYMSSTHSLSWGSFAQLSLACTSWVKYRNDTRMPRHNQLLHESPEAVRLLLTVSRALSSMTLFQRESWPSEVAYGCSSEKSSNHPSTPIVRMRVVSHMKYIDISHPTDKTRSNRLYYGIQRMPFYPTLISKLHACPYFF